MTECRLVLARAAVDAASRIGAARAAHLALIGPMAAAGELLAGVPLQDAAGQYQGSLMLLRPEALERYLEAEPFRQEGVWQSHAVHVFRLAPLPWRPLPAEPAPEQLTHTIAIAWDGRDEAAPARRPAAREAHFARVEPAARAGLLALGGAILDAPGGRMVGSVAITAHPSVAAAQGWWAEDPYLRQDVWREVSWHATRFAPLPYRPLPGAG
ncbi:YciI family protein [Teichococcus aestuarii]|uniref:YciI family protein n=1 Tax=Teichococcus aestuarii TaxID=568898 RepID=UPI00361CD521